jgi:hypothetical protein
MAAAAVAVPMDAVAPLDAVVRPGYVRLRHINGGEPISLLDVSGVYRDGMDEFVRVGGNRFWRRDNVEGIFVFPDFTLQLGRAFQDDRFIRSMELGFREHGRDTIPQPVLYYKCFFLAEHHDAIRAALVDWYHQLGGDDGDYGASLCFFAAFALGPRAFRTPFSPSRVRREMEPWRLSLGEWTYLGKHVRDCFMPQGETLDQIAAQVGFDVPRTDLMNQLTHMFEVETDRLDAAALEEEKKERATETMRRELEARDPFQAALSVVVPLMHEIGGICVPLFDRSRGWSAVPPDNFTKPAIIAAARLLRCTTWSDAKSVLIDDRESLAVLSSDAINELIQLAVTDQHLPDHVQFSPLLSKTQIYDTHAHRARTSFDVALLLTQWTTSMQFWDTRLASMAAGDEVVRNPEISVPLPSAATVPALLEHMVLDAPRCILLIRDLLRCMAFRGVAEDRHQWQPNALVYHNSRALLRVMYPVIRESPRHFALFLHWYYRCRGRLLAHRTTDAAPSFPVTVEHARALGPNLCPPSFSEVIGFVVLQWELDFDRLVRFNSEQSSVAERLQPWFHAHGVDATVDDIVRNPSIVQ